MTTTERKPESSPGPWALEPDHRPGMEWNIHIVLEENPDMRVCFMSTGPQSEANAELIVRACNAWFDIEQLKARVCELESGQ
ncbi:hypothetical protein [Bradyrhizobium sp. Leo121]|uniref:hypothetical protein n=1 Tax=Bradyrhizobium sp. Leo121 TaxID=1571195 RepID=UPI001028BF57|nr:hypothetical protein [Bradyrhizobium sp. Leo121]RZN19501.1 hypothetical protein CWO90_35310 [Bradyrhizobium sp. Leo121]